MKIFFLILLLLIAAPVRAQVLVPYAADDEGIGFQQSYWVPSIQRVVVMFGTGGGPATGGGAWNSVRAFDPISNTWMYLYVNDPPVGSPGHLGIANRDNQHSFYIPALDEFWVWGGSHVNEQADPNARIYSGRFSLSLCHPVVADCGRWTFRSTAAEGNNGNIGTGRVVGDHLPIIAGTNPGCAWSIAANSGICAFGSLNGSPVDNYLIVEPNTVSSACSGGGSGSEPYISCQPVGGVRPPIRDQCQNCLVAVGTDVYLFGGEFQSSIDLIHRNRIDVWKYSFTTHTWTQLADVPFTVPNYQSVLTYDSDRNGLLTWVGDHTYFYNIATATWTDKTPATQTCVFNHLGVYAPSSKTHVFEGGQVCGGPNEGTSSGLHKGIDLNQSTYGGLTMPLRTWVRVPFATNGAPHGSSKHLRLATNLTNGEIYYLGGDYSTSNGINSNWQTWRYNVVTDTYTLEVNPVCGAKNEVIPGGPDEVGWVWDSTHSKFWMFPGYMSLTEVAQGQSCVSVANWPTLGTPLVLSGYHVQTVREVSTNHYYIPGTDFTLSIDDPNNVITLTNISIPAGNVQVTYEGPTVALSYANDVGLSHIPSIMTLDPATHKWTLPSIAAEESGSTASKNGVYDPVTDSIWRVGLNAGSAAVFKQYCVTTNAGCGTANTWHLFSAFPYTEDPNREMLAIDVVGRKLYVIEPAIYRLIEFDLTTHVVTVKAAIPEPNPGWVACSRAGTCPGIGNSTMVHFDSINNVLLFPYIDGLSDDGGLYGSKPRLLMFHPNTNSWETDAMFQPEGQEVRGNSSVFDSVHNVLLVQGGQRFGDFDPTVTHFFYIAMLMKYRLPPLPRSSSIHPVLAMWR